MTRPVDVELPQADRPGQIVACMVTILRAFGWDLGEKYDQHMRGEHGEHWLEDLRRQRDLPNAPAMYRRPLNLHDPSFGINEPLRNPDSPLRRWLPSGREFYDLLDAVGRVRNQEQHFENPPSLGDLKHRAELVRIVADRIGLPVADDCRAVIQRVLALQTGEVFADGSGQKHEGLLEAERERAAELAKEVAAQREALIRAREDGAAGIAELERDLAEAEAQRAATAEQLAAAQRLLQIENAATRASAPQLPTQPGEPWTNVPPARVLRLLPHVLDLYDPSTTTLLSDEVGAVASDAAQRWQQWLPHGGVVLLTDQGQGVALVGATWTYLGSLDEEAHATGQDQ